MIFIGFLLVIIFGLFLLKSISFYGKWYEKLALSYLLGFGVLSVLFFVFIKITNNVRSSDFWLILFGLILVMFILKPFKVSFRYKFRKLLQFKNILLRQNILTYLSWLTITMLFIITMIYSLYWGVYTTDSFSLYDFRSKVMFISGSLSALKSVPSWFAYPMFTSMIGLFIRFMGGSNPSIFYPLMYLSFAVIFFSALKIKLNTSISSLGTALMYSTPITLWQSRLDGLTNLPYTIFFCASLIYLYRFMSEVKMVKQNAIISSLFLALMFWTRATEPIWIVVVLMSLYVFIISRNYFYIIVYSLPFLFVRRIWLTYNGEDIISAQSSAIKVVKYVANNSFSESFWEKIIHVFTFVTPILLSSLFPVMIIFFVTFMIQILFLKHMDKGQVFFLLSIWGTFAVLFLGTLFFSLNFSYWEGLDISLSRLSGILSPLMWFYIILFPNWNNIGHLFKKKILRYKP